MRTSGLGGHCYFLLSVVVEFIVFELAMVDSPMFADGKQHVGLGFIVFTARCTVVQSAVL